MPGDKPEVGVRLVVQNLADFNKDIDAALAKIREARKEIEVTLKLNFIAVINQSDLDNVKAQVKKTAQDASTSAVVTFTAKADAASMQQAAQAATTTMQKAAANASRTARGTAAGADPVKERARTIQDLARIERDVDARRVSMLQPRERLEYEYNQRLAEQLVLREKLRTTGTPEDVERVNQTISAEDALYKQRVAKMDADAAEAQRVREQRDADAAKAQSAHDQQKAASAAEAQRARDQRDADEAQRALRNEQRAAADALARQQRQAEDAAWSQLPPRERMAREYERDQRRLEAEFNATSDETARAFISSTMDERRKRFETEVESFTDTQKNALARSIRSLEDEIRNTGRARGQSYYDFEELDRQKADFDAKVKKIGQDFGDEITEDQRRQIDSLTQQAGFLYEKGQEQIDDRLKENLRRQYFEKSFLGELAREETRTYGIRIMASEFQRMGAAMFGTGLGISLFAQRQAEDYMVQFRQPISRVSRALDLGPALQTDLEDILLSRAGKQSREYAADQANAMRIWSEAINVTVKSQQDLLDVTGEMDTGLVPQTEMISNLVRLNEGSSTLDQTVTDVAAIMTQFNLATQDAAVQTNNLQLVIGLLDTAASSGLAEIDDIGSSLKFFAGRAFDLGVELPEAVATIEMLAQVGLKGSQAGRGVDQLLKSIVAPTPKAIGTFSELLQPSYGDDWQKAFFDDQGTFKGMANFLQEMARATKEMSVQQRQSSLATLGDANAVRTLNALLIRTNEAYAYGVDYLGTLTRLRENGIEGIEREVAILERLTGLDFGTMSAVDSFEARLAQLKVQIEEVYQQSLKRLDASMLTLGKNMASGVVPVFDALADAMGRVAGIVDKYPWLAKGAVGVGAGLIVGGAALMGLSTLARAGVNLLTVSTAVKAAMVNSRAAGGLPFRTAVMGLNAGQEMTVAAGARLLAGSKMTMTEMQQLALIRASVSGQPIVDKARLTSIMEGAAATAGVAASKSFSRTFSQGVLAFLGTAFSLKMLVPVELLLRPVIKAAREEAMDVFNAQYDPTARTLSALDPRMTGAWMLGPTPVQMMGYVSGGVEVVKDAIKFVGSFFGVDVEELVQKAIDSLEEMGEEDPFVKGFSDSNLGQFFANFGKELAGLPDALRQGILDAVLNIVKGDPSASYMLAGANVAVEKVTKGDILGAIRAGMWWWATDEVKAAQQGLVEGRPPEYSYPTPWDFRTEAREGRAYKPLTQAELAVMIGDMMSSQWDLFPDDEIIGKTTGELIETTGELATEMTAAGVPAGEVERYLNDAAQSMAALESAAGDSIGTTWELAAAADKLEKKTRETALNMIAMAQLETGSALDKYLSPETLFGVDVLAMQEDYAKQIDSMASEMQKLGMPEEEVDRIRTAAINALKTIGAAIAGQIEQIPAAVFSGLMYNPGYTAWIEQQGAPGVKPAQAAESFDQSLIEPRGILAAAKLAEAALTSDERKSQEIEDYLSDVAAAFGTGSQEYITATNNAARANANLANSSKKAARTFEDIVSELRGMIAGYIKPDKGLSVTNEEMAQTRMGKYEDGAWEPLRRLASAATDPNSEWKDMLPPGIGVASPEAKDYFETVKAGVERFDPAYEAFFPDRGKVVESVIRDLEGKQREEQYITSVIEEMAAMGYDEAALKKYFEDPSVELEKSVSYLRDGVADQRLATDDNTLATKDLTAKTDEQIGKINENIAAMLALAEAVKAMPIPPPPPPPPPPDGASPDGTTPDGAGPTPNPDSGATAFARGGLVTRPTYAMIGEAGPEVVLPLTKMDAPVWKEWLSRAVPNVSLPSRGFVAPQPQISLRTMAPQIGNINMTTTVTSPSPAYVAHVASRSQRAMAQNIGRQILRAAAREGS